MEDHKLNSEWGWHENISSDPYDDYREPPQGCTKFIAEVGVVAILVAVAMWFLSCSTPQGLHDTTEKIRTEREIIRDTTIVTQADSATIRALMSCDSTNNVLLLALETEAGERIDPHVTLHQHENGTLLLQFDCKEDSLAYEIQLRDKVIEEMKSTTREVAVKYVPEYYKNTSKGFWVLLVILILIVGAWVAKIVIKLKTGGLL